MKIHSILILGAKSDIGMAIAHRFAKAGYSIQLAARNIIELESDSKDIALRYNAKVTVHEFDVLKTSTHKKFLDNLPEIPSVTVSSVGYMGEQKINENNLEELTKVIRTNFEGPANIFSEIANKFEIRGYGTLIGISSVAGERGRAKNYIYGSSKSAFTTFLSGLRNRLSKKNIHVLTVLPGFVDTKMTKNLDLPPRLTVKPFELAKIVFNAYKKKKNIVYIGKIWFLIMMLIRSIPESIFKLMKL